MLEHTQAELAKMQAKDVSKLEPAKLMKHEAKISTLQTQISGYESKIECSARRTLSLAVEPASVKKARIVWIDTDVKRLVYARTENNHRFQEHNNNMGQNLPQKWDIVTSAFKPRHSVYL